MTPWATLQYLETVEPVGDAFADWEVFYAGWENQAAKLMPVEYQEEYKRKYDRKMNVNGLQVEVGSRVQLRKKTKSKMRLEWTPHFSYLEVMKVNEKNMTVKLKNPVTKYIFKKSKPISKLRLYRGKA